jgi:hypothetical protein
VSTHSDSLALGADASPQRANSAGPGRVLRSAWHRVAAISSGAYGCLGDALYLAQAKTSADLQRRVDHLERAARDGRG